MIGLHTQLQVVKYSESSQKRRSSTQSFLSGPSRRFQPTGDGGGGGGCSKFKLCSNADVYLGCREDSIALAMSWLKVDEARTEGRKLTCGIFATEFAEVTYEFGQGLGR